MHILLSFICLFGLTDIVPSHDSNITISIPIDVLASPNVG